MLESELWEILLALDRDEILDRTARLVTERLGFHVAWLAQGCASGATISHSSGATPQLIGVVMRPGRGLGGKVLAQRRPAIVEDYLHSTAISHDYDREIERERVRGVVSVPILVPGEPPSVLAGAVRGSSAGDRAAAYLEDVARQTSRSLEAAGRVRALATAIVRKEQGRTRDSVRSILKQPLEMIQAELRWALGESAISTPVRNRLGRAVRRMGDLTTALGEWVSDLETPRRNVSLAPRERVVLQALAAGANTREIALNLGISVPTVKTYVSRITERLEARNRAHAVAIARAQGLI